MSNGEADSHQPFSLAKQRKEDTFVYVPAALFLLALMLPLGLIFYEPLTRHYLHKPCVLYGALPLTVLNLVLGRVFAPDRFKSARMMVYAPYFFGCYWFVIFSLALLLNGYLDRSEEVRVKGVITSKFSEPNPHGQGTDYYVAIHLEEPWCKVNDLELSLKKYKRVSIGDEFDLTLKRGFLGVPWLVDHSIGEPPAVSRRVDKSVNR